MCWITIFRCIKIYCEVCLSFVLPGGTICICRFVDFNVPCRKYSLYLLHIQSWRAAQQVAYKEVSIYSRCVFLHHPPYVLDLLYVGFYIYFVLCKPFYFILPFPLGSDPIVVWSCPVSILCLFYYFVFRFFYLKDLRIYKKIHTVAFHFNSSILSENNRPSIFKWSKWCFFFLLASYLQSPTLTALTSLIWSGSWASLTLSLSTSPLAWNALSSSCPRFFWPSNPG